MTRPAILKHLRNIIGVIGYLGYGLGGVVFVTALLPLTLVIAPIRPLRRAALSGIMRIFCAFLTRVYLPSLGVYRVGEITGFSGASHQRPVVYVANHRSRIDALLLLGILRNVGVIMKQEYARLPVYSSFVKHLDFVAVDPRSLSSLGEAVKKCETLIGQGKSLIVFPEGTRAPTGRLLPFKDIGFRLAMTAKVPVVPVVIHSDLPFMAKVKGSHFPERTFTYSVLCLPEVHPESRERPSDYADRVRDIMSKCIADLDRGTIWQTLGKKGR